MKILYITNSLSSHGGLEKILIAKANLLTEKFGYEVEFLLPCTDGEPIYAISSEIKLNYHTPFAGIKYFFSHINKVRRTIKAINPDIIVIANKTIEFYFLPFILFNIKKIREIHQSFYIDQKLVKQSLSRKVKNLIEIWITQKYDKVVVLNKDERTFLNCDNVVVIPNFVEQNNFSATLVSKRAVAIGRLTAIKSFDELLRVWALVERQHPDWYLDIYGQDWDGTLKSLISLKNTLGVKNVNFCGPTSRAEIELLNSSLFLSSSVSEAFPMVLLEAQAAGLVVLSYDSPYGPRNIINDTKDGYIIPVGNITEFARLICELIENEELRKVIGSNAKKNSYRFYSDNVINQWKELFTELHYKGIRIY